MGAAYLAGIAAASGSRRADPTPEGSDKVFVPSIDAEARKRLYDGWKDAVAW
jgi:glycerol kinase